MGLYLQYLQVNIILVIYKSRNYSIYKEYYFIDRVQTILDEVKIDPNVYNRTRKIFTENKNFFVCIIDLIEAKRNFKNNTE